MPTKCIILVERKPEGTHFASFNFQNVLLEMRKPNTLKHSRTYKNANTGMIMKALPFPVVARCDMNVHDSTREFLSVVLKNVNLKS